MYRVHWKLWLNVKNKEKANRYFNALRKKLFCVISEATIEQYWKIPELQILQFDSFHEVETKEEAIYHLLNASQAVADSWLVRGPFEYANGVVEFSGWSHGSGFPLKDAEFSFRIESFV